MRPPGVVSFVIAFGAGLATGLARFQVPAAAAAGLLALVVLHRRPAALYPAALLLGLVQADLASLVTQTACTSRLRAGRVRITARLEGPGREGPVMATPLEAGCRGRLRLRWPSGQPRLAGASVTVTGRWLPRLRTGGRPDGTLLVTGVGTGFGRRPFDSRLRGWIASQTARQFGARAAMVEALILGERGDLDQSLQVAFAQSGLVHLLAISGFHVGLLSTWVFLLLRMLRLGRQAALVAASATSVAYVAFLGWPAPATRAACLGVLLVLSVHRQRRVRPDALLAVTCLGVLLVDPWAVFDVGGWLSAAAIWGVTVFTRWSGPALGRSGFIRTLFASIGATLATAPITAAVFGSVPLIGVVLNFAAIPLAALAVPGVLASLLFSGVQPVAAAFAAGTGLSLAALEKVARLGAAVPGGAVVTEMGIRGAWPWLLFLVSARWVTADRVRGREAARRGAWLAVLLLWAPVGLAWARRDRGGEGKLSLFFLDVGQGDAAALRTPAGRWVLIDAGPKDDRGDAGRRTVAPFLAGRGARRLEMLVLSHAHADHLGGAASVLARIPADEVVEPGRLVHDSLYLAFLDRLAADRIPWFAGRAGDRWEMDGVRFRFLHPDTLWAGWTEDLNEDSLLLVVEYGAFSAVFAGDAGLPVEARLAGRVGRVDVLKAGHHGSRTATGAPWLAELAPRAVILSVGVNRYGHPSGEAMDRIRGSGAGLWRTDRDGTITVRTDGCQVEIGGKARTEQYRIGRVPCSDGPPSPPSRPSSSRRSVWSPRPPGS